MRQLTFASLQVRDLEVSKDFYTQKLGFELAGIPNPDACIFKYNKGEASFAIRKPLTELKDKEVGVGASLWFAIEGSVSDLHRELLEKGVTVLGNINKTPFGNTLLVKDPDGYVITLLETIS